MKRMEASTGQISNAEIAAISATSAAVVLSFEYVNVNQPYYENVAQVQVLEKDLSTIQAAPIMATQEGLQITTQGQQSLNAEASKIKQQILHDKSHQPMYYPHGVILGAEIGVSVLLALAIHKFSNRQAPIPQPVRA